MGSVSVAHVVAATTSHHRNRRFGRATWVDAATMTAAITAMTRSGKAKRSDLVGSRVPASTPWLPRQ